MFNVQKQYHSNSFSMSEDKSGYALSVLWQIKKVNVWILNTILGGVLYDGSLELKTMDLKKTKALISIVKSSENQCWPLHVEDCSEELLHQQSYAIKNQLLCSTLKLSTNESRASLDLDQ